MRSQPHLLLALAFALGLLTAAPAAAQHRATRLGDPATRFAPPLTKPEDLRTLLTDPKMQADIASILEQAGWKGNLDDLRNAAASANITEWAIPVGTRLPFMSSRENGKPVALRDVLWAGQAPADAYVFYFSSNDRRYRVVTPKACSNFLIVDLGPDKPPLLLTKTVPAEASLCAPFEVRIAVRNTGTLPLTQVQVSDPLPPGWKTLDDRTNLIWEAGTLHAAEGREFRFSVVATATGNFANTAKAKSAEWDEVQTTANLIVRAPVLTLECVASNEVFLGRPVEVCLTIRNTGDAPEPRVTVNLPIPAGTTLASTTEGGVEAEGRAVWQLVNLAPQATATVCARFQVPQLGLISFAPAVRGVCAKPVETQCARRIVGIPGILLEVVDLDDPIEVGNEVTYEITVTNQGSAPGTHVKLVCTMPEGQDFVSASGATPVQAQDRTIQIEPVPVLDPKAKASWRVVVKAVKAGDTRFKVDLTSDQFSRPIEEYEATQQY